MHTQDLADANIEKIGQLFPNCLTERINENGKPEMAIDFDKLKQELSKEIVEGNQERYQFTWPGKRDAMRLANTPSNMTLRPCIEDSVDFEKTENLYIEGDNLEVLKLLRENYLGRVKMIYIDPPYNTGSDFVYEDDFTLTTNVFKDRSGLFDINGRMLLDNYEVNSDSNGRFHTDWLNMMYPRLRVSRDLLSDDGVIFISIDDNEIDNLKKICSEIFGEHNYVGCICRATGTTTAQGTNSMGKSYDYALVYSKSNNYEVGGIELSEKDASRYDLEDEKGKFSILQLRRTGGEDRREDRPSMYYGIKTPDGNIVYPKGPTGYDSRWRVGEETFKQMLKDNLIYFKQTGNGYNVYYKFYLEGRTKRPSNLWNDIEGNKKASIDLKSLIPEKVFETPKPIEFIRRMLQISNVSDGDIVLDYFSGSATTAHAVMLNNKELNRNIKFILVQIPEPTNATSEAYKAGYENICQIGKERIRRAGNTIAGRTEENNIFSSETVRASVDTGFRVLKLDTSNMKDVYYKPEDFSDINLFEDNVKPDRTPEDLLFQVMLECNLPLSAKIESKTIAGKEVFNVNDGYLLACFDEDVNETVITEVAKLKPYYFIMRDKSLSSDNVADNFEQIFNAYSKDTIRKIL